MAPFFCICDPSMIRTGSREAGLVPVGLSGVSLQRQPRPLVSDLVAAVPLVVIPAVAA